jgi:hypothetical protein
VKMPQGVQAGFDFRWLHHRCSQGVVGPERELGLE